MLNENEKQEVMNVLSNVDFKKNRLTIELDSVCSQLILITQNKHNEEDEEFYLISNDLGKFEDLEELLVDMSIDFDTIEC